MVVVFDSGIKIKDLIDEVKGELDTAPDLDDKVYVDCINEVERLIYRGIIREKAVGEYDADDKATDGVTETLGNIREIAVELDGIDFVDICNVFAVSSDGEQRIELIRVEPSGKGLYRNCYNKTDIGIECSIELPEWYEPPEKVEYHYIVLPEVKKAGSEQTINLPIEHMEMLKSKMRAQAFMLCGEYQIAANWISMYNTYLESFKEWYASTTQSYGV